MKTYDLHLESGPRHKKTMVHVPGLLGCIANGPTTEEALAATPDAIRAFLAFARAHGETAAPPDAPFRTRIAEHVTEGIWLGNGDPSIVFTCDVAPVSPKELAAWTTRWHAIRSETLALVAPLGDAALQRTPAAGRPVAGILVHVLGAAPAYLRTFGPVTEMNRLAGQAEADPTAVRERLAASTDATLQLLRGLTAADRRTEHRRGSGTWSARKTLRRLLEHEWEHHRELVVRLAQAKR